jgi:hypothetical protein
VNGTPKRILLPPLAPLTRLLALLDIGSDAHLVRGDGMGEFVHDAHECAVVVVGAVVSCHDGEHFGAAEMAFGCEALWRRLRGGVARGERVVEVLQGVAEQAEGDVGLCAVGEEGAVCLERGGVSDGVDGFSIELKKKRCSQKGRVEKKGGVELL